MAAEIVKGPENCDGDPIQPQSTSMDWWNHVVEIEIFRSSAERQSLLIQCGLLSVIDWLRNYSLN